MHDLLHIVHVDVVARVAVRPLLTVAKVLQHLVLHRAREAVHRDGEDGLWCVGFGFCMYEWTDGSINQPSHGLRGILGFVCMSEWMDQSINQPSDALRGVGVVYV